MENDKVTVCGGVNPPSIYTRISGIYDRLSHRIGRYVRRRILWYSEKSNIKKKRKLFSNVELSKEQKNRIDDLFRENYGKTISHDWHRLYQSYTGVYREDYFPEILFTTKLEPLLNPYNIAEFLSDKNLLHPLFRDVVYIPKTYFSCVNGKFRNHEMKYIRKDEVVAALSDFGDCIIKKTVDTSSGRDVMVCSFRDGIDNKSKMTADKLVCMFGNNFVIQEKVTQCAELANLNKSSLNTFRVITYLLGGKVFNCPTTLRLGRSGSDKDNMHAGGIAVGITENGDLRRFAFSEYGDRYESHPDSGTSFDGYQIPHFENVIETSRKLHERMPYLGIISWDLTLDEEYQTVLIEMNPVRQSSWFPQMVNGESLFGNNTAVILKLIRD